MADVRLIDVNAAIERAKESVKIVGYSIWETGEVVEFLEDCPIEDAAPVVHGRWVEIPSLMNLPWKKYRCDHCGCPQDYKHNYCPNCGAMMDLEVLDGQA